jgi:hypothetical protein
LASSARSICRRRSWSTSDQVRHSIYEDGRATFVAGKGAFTAKLIDGRKHLMIRGALKIHALRHLDADALDRPAAKVLIQVARCGFQLNVGQVMVEIKHAVQHRAGLRDQHCQDSAGREP